MQNGWQKNPTLPFYSPSYPVCSFYRRRLFLVRCTAPVFGTAKEGIIYFGRVRSSGPGSTVAGYYPANRILISFHRITGSPTRVMAGVACKNLVKTPRRTKTSRTTDYWPGCGHRSEYTILRLPERQNSLKTVGRSCGGGMARYFCDITRPRGWPFYWDTLENSRRSTFREALMAHVRFLVRNNHAPRRLHR